MKFIKENWIWIAAPVLLIVLAVAAIVLFGSDNSDPHAYSLR